MTPYRHALPQLGGRLFLTDGGLETTLIFNDGMDLPYFAAICALESPEGREKLRRYYRAYADVAHRHGSGLIVESCTWRASADWGSLLGYSNGALRTANRESISLLAELRGEFDAHGVPIVISGCVGPRGDGYVVDSRMTTDEATVYHSEQIDVFSDTDADMVGAITMTYTEEATGVVRAAERASMPVAISFTVETDGRLPSGQPLGEAIDEVDANTSGYPSYYMINCAHPEHFASVLDADRSWTKRIRGVRANASRLSHEELDNAEELDSGNPVELAALYIELTKSLSELNVMGGCCGTDHRHIDQIATHCRPLFD